MKCPVPGCVTRGTKTKLRCAAHRHPEDINLRNRYCDAAGCTTIATWRDPITKRVRLCTRHRRSGSVDRFGRICVRVRCTAVASHGPPGSKAALLCAAHRRPADVDLRVAAAPAAAEPHLFNLELLAAAAALSHFEPQKNDCY